MVRADEGKFYNRMPHFFKEVRKLPLVYIENIAPAEKFTPFQKNYLKKSPSPLSTLRSPLSALHSPRFMLQGIRFYLSVPRQLPKFGARKKICAVNHD